MNTITKMVLLQLLIVCLAGKIVVGLPNGAPPRSCSLMLPRHITFTGIPLKPKHLSQSPYEVKAEIYGKHVRLSITGSRIVAGFLIQARQTENGKAIGMFTLPSQSTDSVAKYQNCTDAEHKYPEFSSITHTSANGKSNLTFLWTPIEINQNISVKFYATLAQSYDVFWLKQQSNEINLMDMRDTSTTTQDIRDPTITPRTTQGMNDSNGTPGQQFLTCWALSTMALTFMMNMFIH